MGSVPPLPVAIFTGHADRPAIVLRILLRRKTNMAGWRGQTALITGATGGIGLEIARCCARHGFELVLVARTEQSLSSVATRLAEETGVRCTPMVADLGDPLAPEELAARLAAERITVHALVNNAGFTAYGQFVNFDLHEALDMIQVNVVALTNLTGLLLPSMVGRRSGRILNVSSTAAFLPGPLMTVYHATKAYVLSFSEGLANELQGTGVTVTTLCPGPTATGFQARGRIQETRLIRTGRQMTARAVAEAGFKGMMRGETIVVPGVINKLQTVVVRFLPRAIVTRIMRLVYERTPA